MFSLCAEQTPVFHEKSAEVRFAEFQVCRATSARARNDSPILNRFFVV